MEYAWLVVVYTEHCQGSCCLDTLGFVHKRAIATSVHQGNLAEQLSAIGDIGICQWWTCKYNIKRFVVC